jgi:hypothetical protein
MKYFNDELDRRKFSSIAYYAYCTVHNLNELIIKETNNKYIIVEFDMLKELYKTVNSLMKDKWYDKANYLKLTY